MMQRSIRISTAVIAAVAAAILGAGAARADKWNMPTPYADGNFHSVNIRQFAEEIKADSKGKLEIIVHSGASLFKLPEIKRAVQSGQVPIGETLMSALANEDPIFEATNVPFLAKGFDKADLLWQAIRAHVEERLAKQGLVLLFAAPWPSQGVYTKEPIKDLGGYRGLKMRAYDRVTSRFAELLGAVPVTVQAAEIPQAFATGIIQAMITSATTGADTKSWDYVRNYYDFQAMITRNIVIANARSFNALDRDTQQIVRAAAGRALERGTNVAKELEEKSKIALRENGVNVVAPSPELAAAMAKIGESLTREWADKAGVNGADILKQVR